MFASNWCFLEVKVSLASNQWRLSSTYVRHLNKTRSAEARRHQRAIHLHPVRHKWDLLEQRESFFDVAFPENLRCVSFQHNLPLPANFADSPQGQVIEVWEDLQQDFYGKLLYNLIFDNRLLLFRSWTRQKIHEVSDIPRRIHVQSSVHAKVLVHTVNFTAVVELLLVVRHLFIAGIFFVVGEFRQIMVFDLNLSLVVEDEGMANPTNWLTETRPVKAITDEAAVLLWKVID